MQARGTALSAPSGRIPARVAAGLAVAWAVIAAIEERGRGDDWRIFWRAGHAVGGPALFKAQFVYVPGAAWFLWPFAHFSIATSYFLYAALMIAAGLGAARLAAMIYRISFETAVVMTLAWFPFTIALCLGQNSPVALLLVMLVVLGVVRNDQLLAGAAAGLLLYKPTDAIALLFLFALLRFWRALAYAAVCAAVWYMLSVAATSDWLWPVAYFHTLAVLYQKDIALNSDFAISVPVFLYRAGLPTIVSWIAAAAILGASAPLLKRIPRINAVSVAPLLALAASPHAWGYEAVLVLPAMWLALSRAYRRAIVPLALAYLLAPLYFYSRQMHFDVLAIIVLGGAAVWVVVEVAAGLNAENRSNNAKTPAPGGQVEQA